MGKRYLIDSNVVIDYTSNLLPESSLKVIEFVLNTEFCISFITKIEVLGFNNTPEKEMLLREFLEIAALINVDEQIIEQTILLRKKMKIKLPDAILASSALANNLILITRNTKDFSAIENLELLNPYTI